MSPPDLTTEIALQEIKDKLERIEVLLEAIAAAVEVPTPIERSPAPSKEAWGDPMRTDNGGKID